MGKMALECAGDALALAFGAFRCLVDVASAYGGDGEESGLGLRLRELLSRWNALVDGESATEGLVSRGEEWFFRLWPSEPKGVPWSFEEVEPVVLPISVSYGREALLLERLLARHRGRRVADFVRLLDLLSFSRDAIIFEHNLWEREGSGDGAEPSKVVGAIEARRLGVFAGHFPGELSPEGISSESLGRFARLSRRYPVLHLERVVSADGDWSGYLAVSDDGFDGIFPSVSLAMGEGL